MQVWISLMTCHDLISLLSYLIILIHYINNKAIAKSCGICLNILSYDAHVEDRGMNPLQEIRLILWIAGFVSVCWCAIMIWPLMSARLHGHSVTVMCNPDPGAAEDRKMERTRGLMCCFCSNAPASTHPSDALCLPPNITVTDCPRTREREHKERSAPKMNEESKRVSERERERAVIETQQ